MRETLIPTPILVGVVKITSEEDDGFAVEEGEEELVGGVVGLEEMCDTVWV